MKPIIKASLHDRRGGIIGWTVGIGIYIALNILVYSSISGQAKAINQALDNLPGGAKALFGSASGDFLSPIGYLNSKLYYFILPLLFTMLAITIAGRLFAREEEDGTMELLLSRPVSRSKLLLAKLMAGLIIVLIVGLATLAVTVACLLAIDYDISLIRVVQAHALTLLLGLLFGAVAWAVIGLGRFGRRASVGIACFVALGSYLVTSLETFADWLKWPAKFLPYHYFDPAAVLHGSFSWWNAAGMAIAAIVILLIAFVGFRRRDLA